MPEKESKASRPNPGSISEQEIIEEIQKMNLPANNHKYNKEMPERRLSKVVQGNVTTRKKSLGKKFGETFLAEDMKSVGDYLLFDVLVPAVKDTIVNIVTNGINAFVYGDTRPAQKSRFSAPYGSGRSIGYTSYSSYSRPRQPEGSFRSGRDSGYLQDSKEPILDSRMDAVSVLDELNDCICEYDQATVGDLYDLMGFDSEHTDYKWGWTDLSTATVRKVRQGWLIDLPKPSKL